MSHFVLENYGSIWVAKFNLQCNMQNDNAIFKMSMQYSKWQCISVFKFTFSITHMCKVWCRRKMKIKLYYLHLPFPTVVLICKVHTVLMLYKLQN